MLGNKDIGWIRVRPGSLGGRPLLGDVEIILNIRHGVGERKDVPGVERFLSKLGFGDMG